MEKIKVLWFTNTPSLAIKKLSDSYNVGQSWIESLEKVFSCRENIELSIAFHWDTKKIESFKIDNYPTRYFTIPKHPLDKIGRYIRRILLLPDSKKVQVNYLKIVEEFQPDIVHIFGTETSFALIIPKIKVPSVIWFQGNLTVYQTKWQSGFPLWKTFFHENIKDIVNGESDLQDFYHYEKLVKREQKIFGLATNFTGRTDWDKRLVSVMAPQAHYHHCEEVLREPFCHHVWSPPVDRDKFIIVTTIRPNPYKGIEMIFETTLKLIPLISVYLEWRVVGVSEHSVFVKSHRKELKKTNGKVKFLGSKSATELLQELSNANVYVHTSHIDNSPNSVCESMLIGMPVVSTNVGGIPSLLKDKKEGLLVQSGDSYAMAGAILEIFNNPQEAHKMGKNARTRGLNRNNAKKIADTLEGIYQKIIKNS